MPFHTSYITSYVTCPHVLFLLSYKMQIWMAPSKVALRMRWGMCAASGMRGTITWIHGIILTLLLSLCCSKIGQKQVKKVSFSPKSTYIKEVAPLLFPGGYSLSSNPKGLITFFFLQEYPHLLPHTYMVSLSPLKWSLNLSVLQISLQVSLIPIPLSGNNVYRRKGN